MVSRAPRYIHRQNAAGCVLLFTVWLASIGVALAGMKTEIRFYKANKQLQQDRVTLVSGDDEPGCHNFLLKTRVYRAAQIGFKSCTLFAEKDCTTGSEVRVSWKREKDPVTQFTQGARWFPAGARGSEVRSWACEPLPARSTSPAR